MSGSKWTPDQAKAITTRGCNLLVAAAAGSGKTAVLVERLIQRITDEFDPVDVDRLLVVTFTKAASGEMRERIGHAIAKELNLNPHSKHLTRQVNLLNKASITTLHSFCLEILRQYFYRLDLDPSFKIADATEAELMKLEILETLLEERYAQGEDNFLNLVDAYGGEKDDSKVREMIIQLYDFSSSHPWPEVWLRNLVELYRPVPELPMEEHPWVKTFLEGLQLEFQGYRLKLQRAYALAQGPGGPEEYTANLLDDLQLVDDLLLSLGTFKGVYQAINSLGFTKLKSCRNKDVDDNLKEQVKNLRDSVKKGIAKIQGEFFSRPPEDYFADFQTIAPLMELLVDLTIEFSQAYKEAKTKKSLVDFGDLEHYALAILMDKESVPGNIIPSPVAQELKEHFVEIFVDEYQDINSVQETILQLVSREGMDLPNNMFMVGDVKQSIYRFRLADPSLFMGKYVLYPREEGMENRGIDLAKNFRSRQEVVDAVNYIFRQIMTPRVGEMTYDDKAELVCGAAYPKLEGFNLACGPVEVHLLEKTLAEETETSDEEEGASLAEGSKDSTEETGEVQGPSLQEQLLELNAAQREARIIGKRILSLVHGTQEFPQPECHVFDKHTGYRPVQYRDIVILLRATRDIANVFLEEFRQLGIPGFADLGTGYFAATEVETMMALLKIIDNPRQDIALAAVLRSPIGGLKAEDLAAIRAVNPQGDFYQCLIELVTTEEASESNLTDDPFESENLTGDKKLGPIIQGLKEKLTVFLAKLDYWRTLARQGSLADLIWTLYNETGYYAYVGAMPGGAQRQANLRALYQRAIQFESTSFRGLFRFLRFVEKFLDNGSDLGAARALGENEDVVRIMSIHKSKGLEFPVVFVAGMGKQFNTMDLKKPYLLHKELGLGIAVVDPVLGLTYPSLAQQAIKRKLQMELLAEEMRVLYVALTRAREKLILVGSVRQLPKSIEKWCENAGHQGWELPDGDLAKAKTYLDWVMPAIGRHQHGQDLRQAARIDETSHITGNITYKDPSAWQVTLWQPEDTLEIQGLAKVGQEDLLEKVIKLEIIDKLPNLNVSNDGVPNEDLPDEDYQSIINNRLSWVYPHNKVTAIAAKTTVTELKRREVLNEAYLHLDEGVHQWQPRINSRPRFLQGTTQLTSSERGSAIHLVMQHLKLEGDITSGVIQEQIAQMVIKELLTAEQGEVIDVGAIVNFFRQPYGQRLLLAPKVHRELPFILSLDASTVHGELEPNSEEKVLIQGVIDCLIEEEDGLVLIDYKTDSIKNQAEAQEELRDKYQSQLDLYTQAVERILKKPVKEKYIYSFTLNSFIAC